MIVDYKCQECKTVYTLLIPREPIPDKCTKCGGKVKKVISKGSFTLDGITY